MKLPASATFATVALVTQCLLGCSAARPSAAEHSPRETATSLRSAAKAHCTAGQLGAALEGSSQPGTAGMGLAIIYVWNNSAAACTLIGPVTVAGLNSGGRQVTNSVRFAITPGSPPLSPRGIGPSPLGRLPAHEVAAGMLLIAAGAHPPEGQSCRTHQVDPALWRISLISGGSITARNASPSAGPALSSNGGLTTCHGRLGHQSPMNISA